MKRQMDFLTAEATGKRNAKDMVAGRNLADAQKKDEIGKKVREINELVKAHKYRDAESSPWEVTITAGQTEDVPVLKMN